MLKPRLNVHSEREDVSPRLQVAPPGRHPAATSAALDAVRKSRRLRYTLWGVISDERISGLFLINIGALYIAAPVKAVG